MINVFISYAREDEEIAKEIFTFLEANGYNPWLDTKKLVPGMNWQREIEIALDRSHLQIFVLSPRSTEKRGVFQREIRIALSKAQDLLDCDISIIPLRVEEADVPDALRKYQWVEYTSESRNTDLISAIRHAANQRGLLTKEISATPIVSEIVSAEDRSSDGSVVSSISVPRVMIPSNPMLGELISSMILGSASQIVFEFKRGVDRRMSEVYDRPHEVSVQTEMKYISSSILSAESFIYVDNLGAHGNGYTSSLNILIRDQKSFSCADMFNSLDFVVDRLRDEATQTKDSFLFEDSAIDEVVEAAMRDNTILDKSGLQVTFNQYEAFCYAHGPVIFSFGWDNPELADAKMSPFGIHIKRLMTRVDQ
jgi:hypothetical protein